MSLNILKCVKNKFYYIMKIIIIQFFIFKCLLSMFICLCITTKNLHRLEKNNYFTDEYSML